MVIKKTGKVYELIVNATELGTITNALEDASVTWAEGSESELEAQMLILQITRITGY